MSSLAGMRWWLEQLCDDSFPVGSTVAKTLC